MHLSLPFLASLATLSPRSAPSLEGQLSRINDTYIGLKITNHQDSDVSLLKWNTFLDPSTAFNSFRATPKGSDRNLTAGVSMLRKIHDTNATLSKHDVVSIKSGSSWQAAYDMTQVFNVTTEGDYSISLSAKTQVLKDVKSVKGGTSITISSNALTTRLDKSRNSLKSRDLQKRATLSPTCDAAQQDVISQAVTVANKMAKAAYYAVDNNQNLYQEYFNDHSQNTVSPPSSSPNPPTLSHHHHQTPLNTH